MHAFKRLFVSNLLFYVIFFAQAQQYNFRNYTAVNGLGSNIVNQVFQDSRGYIWFATQGGGASRFNGATFKNFTNTDSLINNDVTCFGEDRQGNIWIGTAEGASKFNGHKFTSYGRKEGLSNGAIYAIYTDSANRVWFATGDDGVKIFDGNKFTDLKSKDSLPAGAVFTIAREKNGDYWFGLEKGIAKYNGNTVTIFDSVKLGRGNGFFSSLADNRGNIWFGGTAGGVLVYNEKTFENFVLPDSLTPDPIGGISQDRKGDIWFATNHGVLKYTGKTLKLFSEKDGLSINTTLSVAVDYEDNVWIGTQDGGVNLFSNEAFVIYTDKHGLSNNNVSCLYADTVQNLFYAGTAKAGLNFLNPASGTKFRAISGIEKIKDINTFSLDMDKVGRLWIGADEGVFVLKKVGTNYLLANSYTIKSGTKIIHDMRGNTWVASYGSGIFVISDTGQRCYAKKNGFPSDNILTVFEDSKSNKWIGTEDAGAIRFDAKGAELFSLNGDFADKTVWAITEDNRANIYFGTGEGGVYRYDGKTLKKYTTDSNICSNSISALQWDNDENCLWIGSAKGINKVKFGTDGNIISIRTFPGIAVNSNAIQVDKKSLVWFGSANGLYVYNSKYDAPGLPFKIQLAEVKLNNQPVDWVRFSDSIDPATKLPVGLVLSYKNNHLSFEFQALTTDNVKYTYMLEGLDLDWSPLNLVNEANYANISPGKKYTFRVKAINANGINSTEVATFTFTIAPPWWATWWFRALVFAMAIASIATFIKAREKVLKDQNIKLEKTVVERTAEVVAQKDVILLEKKRSDDLLLNILPSEVADELKEKGYADAKLFDNVTVIFTDFKSFTKVSERLTPQQLVDELNVCFSAFDGIVSKYGIEKIKTVGDAYLAVCGLPVADEGHAVKMLNAAVEIRNFMLNRKTNLGEQTFEIRIGVHSGSLVAGIVGIKKFAYDVWGDTVNTAARMEQNSEAGKINISEATYELVKDKLICVYRGEIEAKNKGKLKMYFVT